MRSKLLNYAVVSMVLTLLLSMPLGCNKKCRALQSSFSGKIVGMYDFKECFIYAQFDTTLVIASDTAFTSYKNAHFKNCTASLDPVDFNKNMILGYKVKVLACNAAFHRSVDIDSTAKVYHYTVTIEKCSGCGTDITSTNIVVAPQVPSGYKLEFVTKDQ